MDVLANPDNSDYRAFFEGEPNSVRFLAAIDKGLEDVIKGRVLTHQQVKESISKWISE